MTKPEKPTGNGACLRPGMLKYKLILLLILLMAAHLHAQWDSRPRLYLEPKAAIIQDTSAALAIDLDLDYNNEGPDTLFMFIEVEGDSLINLDLGNMKMPTILIHFSGWYIDESTQIDLEAPSPCYSNNGHRLETIYAIAIPPEMPRTVRLQIRIDSAGFHQPDNMRFRILGTTYTHEFDQAMKEGRWSVRPAPTNPHGRRLHAVDITIHHKQGKEDIVTAKVVTKPLEEPLVYSQPLNYIEGLLKEWKGIGPWSVSRVGEVILLKHKDKGKYYSALSPSRRYEHQSHWRPAHVELGIALIRHIPEQNLMRLYMKQLDRDHRHQNLQEKADEYKCSSLDSKLPHVQRKVARHYRLLPTHLLDPKHDILVFTYGPNNWAALVEDDPVTRDYEALCQYIRQNFNLVWRRGEVQYLGNVGKKMLGIPLKHNP